MSATPPTLPIWATIRGAYGFLFANLRGLFDVALIPAAAILVIDAAVWYFARYSDAESGSRAVLTVLWILPLACTFILPIPALVKWHRANLDSAERAALRVGLRFRRRDWNFLVYGVLVGLIMIAAAGAPLAVGLLVWEDTGLAMAMIGGAFVVSLYLFARFCLVFPAASIDLTPRLSAAWQQTGGNGIRLTLVLFAVELPWQLVDWFVLPVIEGFLPQEALLPTLLPRLVILALSYAVLNSAVAIAYRTLVAASGESDAQ